MTILTYLFIIFAKLRNMVRILPSVLRPAQIGIFIQWLASSHQIQVAVPVSGSLLHCQSFLILFLRLIEPYPAGVTWYILRYKGYHQFRAYLRLYFFPAAFHQGQQHNKNGNCQFHFHIAWFRFDRTAKLDADIIFEIDFWISKF